MQVIPLLAIAKQNLQVTLAGVPYDIDVLSCAGIMALNLTRAGAIVCQGQRVVAAQLCLPYLSQEAGQGNLMFLTENDVLPSYPDFGTTTFFIYASAAELAAVRAAPTVVMALLKSGGTIVGSATVRGVT